MKSLGNRHSERSHLWRSDESRTYMNTGFFISLRSILNDLFLVLAFTGIRTLLFFRSIVLL